MASATHPLGDAGCPFEPEAGLLPWEGVFGVPEEGVLPCDGLDPGVPHPQGPDTAARALANAVAVAVATAVATAVALDVAVPPGLNESRN